MEQRPNCLFWILVWLHKDSCRARSPHQAVGGEIGINQLGQRSLWRTTLLHYFRDQGLLWCQKGPPASLVWESQQVLNRRYRFQLQSQSQTTLLKCPKESWAHNGYLKWSKVVQKVKVARQERDDEANNALFGVEPYSIVDTKQSKLSQTKRPDSVKFRGTDIL